MVESADLNVFQTHQEGADHIARDEHGQKPVVQVVVMLGVEDGQKNKTQSPSNREKNRSNSTGLVEPPFVSGKLAGMAKPTFRKETKIHEYDCYYTACNEQRFESFGSDMGNVTGCSIDSVYVGSMFIS